MVFYMFLAFLIFDPNRPFSKGYSMGYSLCKMTNFQNGLISGIFVFFFEQFFAQNNSNCLVQCFFCAFLAFLIFDRNRPFCKGYSLCMDYSLCKMADFKNGLIS